MQSIFVIYVLFLSIALLAFIFFLSRGNEQSTRRFARVRVRVDDTRRSRHPEPPEEEFETRLSPEMLVLGALLLLILILIGRA